MRATGIQPRQKKKKRERERNFGSRGVGVLGGVNPPPLRTRLMRIKISKPPTVYVLFLKVPQFFMHERFSCAIDTRVWNLLERSTSAVKCKFEEQATHASMEFVQRIKEHNHNISITFECERKLVTNTNSRNLANAFSGIHSIVESGSPPRFRQYSILFKANG